MTAGQGVADTIGTGVMPGGMEMMDKPRRTRRSSKSAISAKWRAKPAAVKVTKHRQALAFE